MKCKTCGIEGHDSQGSKELCLIAVVDRCKRMEVTRVAAVTIVRDLLEWCSPLPMNWREIACLSAADAFVKRHE